MSLIAKTLRLRLDHIRHFVDQAEHDPSVTKSMLQDWQGKLERELHTQSERFKYSELYCRLTDEWVRESRVSADMFVPFQILVFI